MVLVGRHEVQALVDDAVAVGIHRVRIGAERRDSVLQAAKEQRINLRLMDDGESLCVSLDETTRPAELPVLWKVFGSDGDLTVDALTPQVERAYHQGLERESDYLDFLDVHEEVAGSVLAFVEALADQLAGVRSAVR